MILVHCDIETRSTLDLRETNVYRYVEDPRFAVLMTAWSVDGAPVQVAEGLPAQVRELLADSSVRFVAHNATFERVCLSRALGLPEPMSPDRWDDTMARAAEFGLPQSLDRLARMLGVTPKDSAGTRLINLFSKPNADGGFNDAASHPAQWAEFLAYCAQDVATLVEVDALLPGWPTSTERAVWLADARINDRGVAIDVPMATAAAAASAANRTGMLAEMAELTGLANPNSVAQLTRWAGLPNLREATVTAALADEATDPMVRRVLELRQETALAASSKFTAALAHVCADGRVRGALRFYGAHTGRWAGRGLQLQNAPRAHLDSDEAVDAAICDLKLALGADQATLKALVRPLLVGPFTVADYAAIEARVIAWLAGEQWALQAFQDGRDIYVATAERLGEGYDRQQGKVATLSLGFAGSVRALRRMGAQGSDEELRVLVDAWREANPTIVTLWGDLAQAFADGGLAGPHLRVVRKGSTRKLYLPSGRAIMYHNVRWEHYQVEDPETGEVLRKEGWRYADPRSPQRIGTYGGRTAENATQAVARDLLAEALVRLADAGLPVVAHVHDEVVLDGLHPVEEIVKIMCEPPAWAQGLPIDAEGFVCKRYRKG